MFSRILRSLVIISIFAAMGCSNQAPNDASTKINNSIENETAPPATVKSLVTIEGEKAIETTLSDRRVSENGTEIKFTVNTDVAIEGQTEFVVALYGRDLGDDRALAGYRLQDASGKTLWTSEYAANTIDMSWIQLMRTDGEHTWSVEIETGSDTKRQIHRLDDSVVCLASPLVNTTVADKQNYDDDPMSRQVKDFYDNNVSKIDTRPEDFVVSILADENLLPWISGASDEQSEDGGPDYVIGDWASFSCDIVRAFYEEFCQKGTNGSQALCTLLMIIATICEVMGKVQSF